EGQLRRLCGDAAVDRAKGLPGSDEQLRVTFDPVSGQQVVLDIRKRLRPVEKHWHWEQKGVPLRVEIGPRDVESGKIVLKERLTGSKEFLAADAFGPTELRAKLDAIQAAMLERAEAFRDEHTVDVSSKNQLTKRIQKNAGFVRCFFEPDTAAEDEIKSLSGGGTVRLILPEEAKTAPEGECVWTGKKTKMQVLFAQAY
ncbi:MAG: His/Gly/Thr/Pro-type tRNA ligase C-terminal domain-containing protein, partial [Planctomycetota bacterium]